VSVVPVAVADVQGAATDVARQVSDGGATPPYGGKTSLGQPRHKADVGPSRTEADVQRILMQLRASPAQRRATLDAASIELIRALEDEFHARRCR
jgi:hypothetical protein